MALYGSRRRRHIYRLCVSCACVCIGDVRECMCVRACFTLHDTYVRSSGWVYVAWGHGLLLLTPWQIYGFLSFLHARDCTHTCTRCPLSIGREKEEEERYTRDIWALEEERERKKSDEFCSSDWFSTPSRWQKDAPTF